MTMRKIVMTGLFCSILWLGTTCVNRPAWGGGFTADISEQVFNTDATGEIFVGDGQYRMDLRVQDKQGGRNPIIIVDRKAGRTLLLNAKTKTYEEAKNFTFRAYMLDPFQSIETLEKTVEKKTAGAETLEGYACDKYEYFDGSAKLAEVWLARDLQFPIKIHIVSGRGEGSINVKTNIGDTRVELRNIKEGPVDPGLFRIPEGYARAKRPEPPKKKVAASLPSVSGMEKGTSPWGRRITQGGEIRVKVDPERPCKIRLKNLADQSAYTVTAFKKGALENAAQPKKYTLDKRGQKREVSLGQVKKTREVSIRVDQGLIYAVVMNEKKDFDRDDTVREAYLIENQAMGYTVEPKKELKISMTGDSQDSAYSEVKLIGYRQEYKDKLFEEVVRLGNGKSKSWTFAPEKNIRTIDVMVDKIGGVKFRMEQPTQAKTKKIVRTQPIKKKQTSNKKAGKTFGAALDKADAKVISLAFFKNDIKTVKAYFEKGMDANITLNGAPLLQKAARQCSAKMVKLVIAQGGDLTYRNRKGQDTLFQAISNTGHWNEVIPVVVEAGVEVNEKASIYKITHKVKNGKFKPGVKETLELLLTKGADINYPTSTSGSTHLMFAAKMAWLEPVEFYLAHGADVNARDRKGNTVLSLAKTKRKGEQPYEEENRKVIIELLKAKGAR
ncbi:MAG: hypothetical protein B1H11_11505 [Desulfobacteraceae bacterium 4484_190.1]|nr:MAG: hypothetical protein B1H11_11505 [Desulfobacteraceae bacterium 4484_190.1]